QLVGNQSARCLAAYLYSASGLGESTTDLAWDGHAVIYENGTLLAESRRFADVAQLALADIDLDRLLADRMRQNTFGAAARRHARERYPCGVACAMSGRALSGRVVPAQEKCRQRKLVFNRSKAPVCGFLQK